MPKFEVLSYLADLAKAGYKPDDVKDLLELAKTAPEIEPNSGSDLDPKDSKKKRKEPDKQPEQPVEDAIEAIIKRESEG